MIRVLHVVTIMNRNGLENRLMDIYRHIDRNQVQFDFLTHRKQDGVFDEEIKELGGKVYHISPLKPQHIVRYMSELKSFFNNHKEYSIVHSHINAFSTFVLFAARDAGVPIRIAHSRTWGAEKSWKSVFKYVAKAFINIPTTHKFGCSRQAGEWLFGKKGIQEPNYFRVITNSIELDKFSYDESKRNKMRQELGLSDDQIAITDVARLEPQKNHTFLLKVFKEITKTHSTAKLFLIGEGSLLEKIKDEAKSLGIQDAVVFVGNVSNVGDYLNAMDGFIFPSLFEGFGTVTIESQCCGLPILASDTIPPETKVSSVQEFESLKSSPEDWAKHILNMISSIKRKDCRDVIKEAGFDINDTYSFLQNFYLEVADSKSKSY